MNWRDLKVIAFDTETTGLSAHDSDRVIEFGAVELRVDDEGHVRSVKKHSMFFNPGISIPPAVVKLTGITDEMVADAPPFEKGARRVRELMSGGLCVAHNYPFDRGFLSMELRRAGLSWPDPVAEVDTVDLSIRMFPDASSHKLGDVCKRLSVSLENAHRATDDAEACGRVFLELARRRDAPDDLQGMLDWADALGHPPENPWLGLGAEGQIVFRQGDDALGSEGMGVLPGHLVEHHPLVVHWMTMARVRRDGAWHYRFPESLRTWADRFLRVRCSGRARQNSKSFGPGQWGLDSNALV